MPQTISRRPARKLSTKATCRNGRRRMPAEQRGDFLLGILWEHNKKFCSCEINMKKRSTLLRQPQSRPHLMARRGGRTARSVTPSAKEDRERRNVEQPNVHRPRTSRRTAVHHQSHPLTPTLILANHNPSALCSFVIPFARLIPTTSHGRLSHSPPPK